MDTLTKDQARQLATLFTDFSAEIAKYRYDRWEDLSQDERQQLLDLEYNLMTEAGKISALAGVLTLGDVQGSVDEINSAINDTEQFLKKVQDIKTGLSIIAGVFSLVAAVTSKDPKEILAQLKSLKGQIT